MEFEDTIVVSKKVLKSYDDVLKWARRYRSEEENEPEMGVAHTLWVKKMDEIAARLDLAITRIVEPAVK